MEIGISSSCFYPLETEKAFRKVGALGAGTAEIFFNSESELRDPILRDLRQTQAAYGIRVRSIHPFTSYAEPYLLFGGYPRRVREGVSFYTQYFETAAALGAECVVLHGGKLGGTTDEAAYFEAFGMLCEAAKPYGVLPAHEIVNRRSGSDLAFLQRLRSAFPEDFRVVLDIKQCRRCGVDAFAFIEQFAENLVQVHISDGDAQRDCLPPGEGDFDFAALFRALKTAGYDKSAIIELYHWGYESETQIKNSRIYLEKIEKNIAIST